MFIEVAFVNQPSKNPKFGSIKGVDGIYYSVGADVLHRYRKGMSFDAPVQTREWQGKTFYSIPDSFDPGGGEVLRPPYPTPPPRPADNVGQDHNGFIFVTGVVGRAMGSGKFDTQDIKLLTLAAVEAWHEAKNKI